MGARHVQKDTNIKSRIPVPDLTFSVDTMVVALPLVQGRCAPLVFSSSNQDQLGQDQAASGTDVDQRPAKKVVSRVRMGRRGCVHGAERAGLPLLLPAGADSRHGEDW